MLISSIVFCHRNAQVEVIIESNGSEFENIVGALPLRKRLTNTLINVLIIRPKLEGHFIVATEHMDDR